MQAAVGHCARHHPGAEHRADRAPQLFLRVLGKGPLQLLFHQRLEFLDDAEPGVRIDVGVERQFVALLVLLDDFLEFVVIETEPRRNTSG